MLYKSARIKAEWQLLHTQVRNAWFELDAWLQGQGLEGVTITDVGRTPAENFGIYRARYIAQGMEPAAAEEKAASRFTWHDSELMCAADGRGSGEPWGDEVYARVLAWVTARCPVGQFEVLEHDVGRGRHLHIAFRDFLKRREWEQRRRSRAGAV